MTARALAIFPQRPASLGGVSAPNFLCSDAELFRRLRLKQSEALEVLAQRYGKQLARIAAGLLGAGLDVEDVMQDVLLRALSAAPRASSEAELWPWLVGITCNTCREHRRHQTSLLKRLQRWILRQPQISETPAPDLDGDERKAALSRAVGGLPPDYRELIVLRYLEEMPVADVACVFGIAEGTVKSRTHTALNLLRQRMLEEGFDAPE